MLANSLTYAHNIWYDCAAPNSKGETCGYFKANSAGQSNEDGVRTNADFSMICAFLCKYGKGKVTLPEGVTWDMVKGMAVKSLVFGYSTHKANKFKITSDNKYWGSVSNADHVWESSLWATSLAYASYFLNEELDESQKTYIYNMIKAECNYELERSIAHGYERRYESRKKRLGKPTSCPVLWGYTPTMHWPPNGSTACVRLPSIAIRTSMTPKTLRSSTPNMTRPPYKTCTSAKTCMTTIHCKTTITSILLTRMS